MVELVELPDEAFSVSPPPQWGGLNLNSSNSGFARLGSSTPSRGG